MNACHNLFVTVGTAFFVSYNIVTMNKVSEATQKLNECIAYVANQTLLNQSYDGMTCDGLSNELSDRTFEQYMAGGMLAFIIFAGTLLCCPRHG